MKNFQTPKEPGDWYERHGVAPPEHIPHGLTDEQLEQKFAEIREATVHGGWKQKGNYIWCTKCPNQHGDTISVDYLLQGTDKKGLPILTKLS